MGALVKLGACAAAGLIMASGVTGHGHHRHGGLASLLGSGQPIAVHASGNAKLAMTMAASHGWDGVQQSCLWNLWQRESAGTWNPTVTNPYSGAYGIVQALPAGKLAAAGADWRYSARTQIRWGIGYIDHRYGTPCTAWSDWQARNPHWY